jgi:hypothetical protein
MEPINMIPFLCALFLFFVFIPQCMAMERKRDSIPSTRARKRGKTGKEKVDEVESQELGTCFADLPFPIITDILIRLPIKSVLICKCVCKTWNTMISDRHFPNLYFELSPELSPYDFLILICDRRDED